MKTFGLIPLSGLEEQAERVQAVLDRLSRDGARFLCPAQRRSFAARFSQVTPVEEEAFWTGSDRILTLGGDGTILSAAPAAARYGKELFGVNFGHEGFLTACAPEEGEKLSLLLTDRLVRSRRMMLSLSVNGTEKALALNEILLAPRERGRLLSVNLSVNGTPITAFRADALLFHTPTGSTAYAFSAGGAVCSEELEAIGVKAVAPYMHRGGHHMLFGPDAVFDPEDLYVPGGSSEAVADGGAPIPLADADRVQIRRATNDLTLLFAERHDNQSIFCKKQREAGRERQ